MANMSRRLKMLRTQIVNDSARDEADVDDHLSNIHYVRVAANHVSMYVSFKGCVPIFHIRGQ